MGREPDKYRGYTAAQLRVLLQSGQWPPTMTTEAVQWLGEAELRELARIEASQEEQKRTALAAKKAAVVAAIAATITIPLAIIAIIISTLAWLHPRAPVQAHPALPSAPHAASAGSVKR